MASRPSPYLEENLQLDYNHLEAPTCFCGSKKALGEILCAACMAKLPPDEYAQLLGMKPGSGLCSAAATAHREMQRKDNEGFRVKPFGRWRR